MQPGTATLLLYGLTQFLQTLVRQFHDTYLLVLSMDEVLESNSLVKNLALY